MKIILRRVFLEEKEEEEEGGNFLVDFLEEKSESVNLGEIFFRVGLGAFLPCVVVLSTSVFLISHVSQNPFLFADTDYFSGYKSIFRCCIRTHISQLYYDVASIVKQYYDKNWLFYFNNRIIIKMRALVAEIQEENVCESESEIEAEMELCLGLHIPGTVTEEQVLSTQQVQQTKMMIIFSEGDEA
ncbi:MAG: hypothetical protein EZS28_001684 [Streblomastix strix]|uniref:Uncharacterized protein n=1 Tax=Streblomastix strix TaxID=222440 RepID=A0A5J4X692_9EUKA|nr:MAG: hypothetical protein EZS28_001684 [Streblomastix strix]